MVKCKFELPSSCEMTFNIYCIKSQTLLALLGLIRPQQVFLAINAPKSIRPYWYGFCYQKHEVTHKISAHLDH